MNCDTPVCRGRWFTFGVTLTYFGAAHTRTDSLDSVAADGGGSRVCWVETADGDLGERRETEGLPDSHSQSHALEFPNPHC